MVRRRIQLHTRIIRVRLHIIRNEILENVCKTQSCMVSKLRIIWKQTVRAHLQGFLCSSASQASRRICTAGALSWRQRKCQVQRPPRRLDQPEHVFVRPALDTRPSDHGQNLRVRVQLIGHARNNM